jgi:hypothetical protein
LQLWRTRKPACDFNVEAAAFIESRSRPGGVGQLHVERIDGALDRERASARPPLRRMETCYNPVSIARAFSIGKADQQITFEALSNKVV